MARTPTRPVQVRLPESADAFLTQLAAETGQSKTEIVVDALQCLQQRLLERRLETGYRELGGEQDALVRAGLSATLPTIPD